jgi:cbb3-type cytochrome oxidase maturation protein
MNILFLMIPMALLLGIVFVAIFFWAAGNGQLDDLETPAHRMLNDNQRQSNNERLSYDRKC